MPENKTELTLGRRAFFLFKSLVLVYFLSLVILIVMVDHVIFFPSLTKKIEAKPSDIGYKYQASTFETADGVKLRCWYIICSETAEISMFVAHGNAENISTSMYQAAYTGSRIGANVFLYDYRGYGESEGSPSVGSFYQDAEAAYSHFLKIDNVKKHKIIIYGRSLGGAAAVHLASKFECFRLITESTFSSVRNHVRFNKVLFIYYPFTPNYLPSVQKAAEVKVPWLIIHGSDDSAISVKNADVFFDANIAAKREKYIIAGADHNDVLMKAGPDNYCARIASFIK